MRAKKYVKDDVLKVFLREVFVRIECPAELYKPVIEGLIETSLRGVDSHGIRLMPHYVEAALLGRINMAPRFVFQETSPTTVLLEADHTFGIAAANFGMKKAIELAKRSGIGCTAISNSSHFGAAAVYTLMAARENMIGISLTNVDALVLPFGAKEPFLGTNPISFAAPCEGEEPFCLDMATSVISWNKLLQCRMTDTPLEPGWAADKHGKMCTDPHIAQAILPIGGYKGYGLGLVIEVLCSLLTNMPYGRHVPRMFPLTEEKRTLGHFLMAIDVAKFQEVSVFKTRMRKLVGELRSLTPAEGFDRVRVANDPEKEAYLKRSVEGIPVGEDDLANFRRIAQMLEIDERAYPTLFGG